VSRQWEVAVFVGDPTIDGRVRLLAQASYAKRLFRQQVYEAHDSIVDHINARGQAGGPLHYTVEAVFEDFESSGALRKVRIRPYGIIDHLGG